MRATGTPTRLAGSCLRPRLALPPPPPAHLRRRRRPGARRAHAAQRHRAGQGPPRLPVRRLARDRQDLDGEDPRRVPELPGAGRADVEPCGVCDSCVSIAGATSLDVIEMDAASNNSVDDIRDLRERVAYAPVSGRHKVYILDEAHMLSTRRGTRSSRRSRSRRRTRSSCSRRPRRTRCCRRSSTAATASTSRARRSSRSRASCGGSPRPEQIEIADEACALIARAATGSFRDALGTLEQLAHLLGHARSRSTTCWPCSASPTPTCCSARSTRSPPATRARRCWPPPGSPTPAATSAASSATSRRTRAS